MYLRSETVLGLILWTAWGCSATGGGASQDASSGGKVSGSGGKTSAGGNVSPDTGSGGTGMDAATGSGGAISGTGGTGTGGAKVNTGGASTGGVVTSTGGAGGMDSGTNAAGTGGINQGTGGSSTVVETDFSYKWVDSVPPETAPPFLKAEAPAFPRAEGAGMWTVGGRGGKVIEVTSLEDSGPGTLREAIEAKGPRTVVFRTGGVIHLKDRLTITNPYITLAGQTAPGGGIVIADRSFWINTHNVMVRHIRVRMGSGRRDNPGIITDDAFGGRPISDLMVDHVSASWGHDENLSLYKMEDANNDGIAPSTERVTVQWSLIGEALGERFHPYGSVFGGKHATYHHNLHACSVSWEPYKVIEQPMRSLSLNPAPEDLNLVNNVFFIWLNRGLEGGGKGSINIINNWFVPDMDPYAASRDFPMIVKIGAETGGQRSRHMAGNVMQGKDAISKDNWGNVEGDVAKSRSDQPFEMLAPVTIESADKAYAAVLERSGATLPKRDKVDERIVNATRNQKSYYLPIEVKQIDFYPFKEPGIIDLPDYAVGTPPADDDHDGMPNAWEVAKGLDPKNPKDGPRIRSGYSNLEWYLNALAEGDSQAVALAYSQK